MNKVLIFVLIAEFWITVGQVCFKKGANRLIIEETREWREGDSPLERQGTVPFTTPFTWIKQLLNAICTYPVLWMGAITMLIGMLFWFAALSSGELSFVYFLGSIQYIFALIASRIFLYEKINAPKLIGTVLITMGIILTAIS